MLHLNHDDAPALLRERFAVEIGIRQAWPYVTFADHRDGASPLEVRLYIDSGFTVISGPAVLVPADEDDEKLRLLRLAEVLNRTVHDVTVDDDGSLMVSFDDNVCLRVSGHSQSWTTHDVWWLGSCPAG
ncbi:hypothetical protein ABZ412_05355 [Nocardia sp. NPDC005746]|uniref:hypothetical protein n=1 Tax=Nocardia sp. NPDC005746 TaxID=3157062 RepID=UPI0033E781AE